MKKILLLIILISSLICSIAIADEVPEVLKVVMRYSTVQIMSYGREGGTGICSGVVIENESSYSAVLTAKHCISVDEEVYVEDTKSLYISTSTTEDLAVIISPHIPNKQVAEFAKYSSRIGDTVYHLGYPFLEEYTSMGKIKRINSDYQYGDFSVIHGCSGGGVFNSDGQLVGTVWGFIQKGLFSSEGLSIFEPLRDIKKFLDIIKQSYKEAYVQ